MMHLLWRANGAGAGPVKSKPGFLVPAPRKDFAGLCIAPRAHTHSERTGDGWVGVSVLFLQCSQSGRVCARTEQRKRVTFTTSNISNRTAAKGLHQFRGVLANLENAVTELASFVAAPGVKLAGL